MSGPIPPAQPPPAPHHHQHGPLHPLTLWRRRHNPLRRRTDRLQCGIALGLLLLVPALGLVATFTVGDAAHRHYRATAEHQARTRHLTPAVLVHDAPRHPEPGSAEARKTRYPVPVRYTAPASAPAPASGGETRTAETDVLPGLPGGSTVDVWVAADGSLTEAPLTTEQVRGRTMGWAISAFLAVALTGTALYGAAARLLRRRNLAEWDARWAEVAPRWSTSP
ncbi:hypothetical protein GCM10010145_02190 [Streptomyces ruber]|uniref:Proline rich protein membrane protein n=2 Tax=Streptomyces TaxID=1883 RepID=A0A918B6K8_9ACTN|nr:hypothetical protein [Streptomyces ruber]GGQ38434.1 hypothetical protein GCM10010145_02190 [Streptomyces ruber]